MILNTGNRTDIPAFYSEWFYNRVRAGFALARSPYDPSAVTRYRLSPDVVDAILFCTKNPQPMLARLDELAAFRQLWQVTITPYGPDIEPFVPDKERVMEAFRALSARLGRRRVVWRYDPIFLTQRYDLAFHLRTFEQMARALAGSTEACVVSFLDLYEKTRRNFPQGRAVETAAQETLVRAFVEIGQKYGMQLRLCCENPALARFGADVSGCMAKPALERALGLSLRIPKAAQHARAQCACVLGGDLGAYNTCGHGCLYCYANENQAAVRRNRALHDAASPLLVGALRAGDVVREAKQEPYTDGQLTLGL